jgi:uncharacterized membrane protein
MLWNLANTLHTLAAVIWVGGMFFAYVALRPAMAGLPKEDALALWRRTLQTFLRWVLVMVVVLWVTGIYQMFFVLSGFGAAGIHVDTMFATALVMTILFFWLNHGPFRTFKIAADSRDFETAGRVIETVRKIVATNLVLGIITVAVASWGASG